MRLCPDPFQDYAQFAIQSLFKSKYYLGGDELHLPLPIPEEYPAWFPMALRLPPAARRAADWAADQGFLVRRSAPEARFTLKYGLLRGKLLAPAADTALASDAAACAPCAARQVRSAQTRTSTHTPFPPFSPPFPAPLHASKHGTTARAHTNLPGARP